MNSTFDTSTVLFGLLPRKEQELIIIDSQLNGVKIEYWATHYLDWRKTNPPVWDINRRYRRKPELLEQYVNVYPKFTKSYSNENLAKNAAMDNALRVAVHMREVSDEQ